VAHAVGVPAASIGPVSVRGISVGDAPAVPGDLFVALREAGFDGHAHVAESLDGGAALALVAADWDGLPTLAPALRARCLVTDDTLRAFRALAAFARGAFP